MTQFIVTYAGERLFLKFFLFIQANIASNLNGFIDIALNIIIVETTGKNTFQNCRIVLLLKLSCSEVGSDLRLMTFLQKVIFFMYKELRSAWDL